MSWDLRDLRIGNLYRVCVDVDGPTYDVAFGNTGFQIYIAGEILPVGVPMIAAAAGQTVTMSCADCTTSTTAYLATFCDTSLLDASIQANGATNTAPRPIVSVGGNVWSISVDASQLRRGYRYSVCLDLDGATTVSPNADSDIRVYISAVTSAGDGIMRPGACIYWVVIIILSSLLLSLSLLLLL